MPILSRILAATLLLLPTAAIAQQPAAPTAMPSAAFDVVSIKPSGPASRGGALFDATGFRSVGVPLAWAIDAAYIIPFKGTTITDLPPWTQSERYDIVAKIDEASAPAWSKLTVLERQELGRPLVQKLLADRCKLATHTVPAQVNGFSLVVSRRGSRLAPTKPGETYPPEARQIADGAMVVSASRSNDNSIHLFNATLEDLIIQISTNWLIQDQTSLTGRYDFTIRPLVLPRDADGKALPNLQFSDFWDISETGLELKPAKIPTTHLVIDHIERPTPN
jgi:uncharacterized protein (TIGR03435 family)